MELRGYLSHEVFIHLCACTLRILQVQISTHRPSVTVATWLPSLAACASPAPNTVITAAGFLRGHTSHSQGLVKSQYSHGRAGCQTSSRIPDVAQRQRSTTSASLASAKQNVLLRRIRGVIHGTHYTYIYSILLYMLYSTILYYIVYYTVGYIVYYTVGPGPPVFRRRMGGEEGVRESLE